MDQESKEKTFEQVLIEATDSALASLGESARQSIYYHLEKMFNIPKEEIPCHIDDFEDGLEKIFGAGAKYIEILIMKQLFQKVGHPVRLDNYVELAFKDYVTAVKKSFRKGASETRRA